MSVEAPGVEAEVYGQLAERARKHFDASGLSAIVNIGDYDPSRPTHDFDNVFFDANPQFYTPLLFRGLASALSGKGPRAVTESLVRPFEEQIDEIVESAEKRKLMVITGHQTLFEPAYAAYGLQRAAAARSARSYAEMARSTHLMVARALATVDIFGRIPLTSVAQQLTNVYFTFPVSENYRGDGSIPVEFQSASNARMREVFAGNTDREGTIGVLSASGTTEKANGDGVLEIPRVRGGTMKVLLDGWDLLPVGGVFKRGLVADPGEIIRAEDVDEGAVHAAMADVVAASRTRRGVPAVYAEA